MIEGRLCETAFESRASDTNPCNFFAFLQPAAGEIKYSPPSFARVFPNAQTGKDPMSTPLACVIQEFW